jgi:hypothetical protein
MLNSSTTRDRWQVHPHHATDSRNAAKHTACALHESPAQLFVLTQHVSSSLQPTDGLSPAGQAGQRMAVGATGEQPTGVSYVLQVQSLQ